MNAHRATAACGQKRYFAERLKLALRLLWVGVVALHGPALDAAEPERLPQCHISDLGGSYTYPSLEPKILESRTRGERGSLTPMTIIPLPPPVAPAEKQADPTQPAVKATQAKSYVLNLMDAIDRGNVREVERLLSTREMDPRGLRDENGEWAITLASQRGVPEITRALIRYGVPLRPDEDTAKGGGDLTPVLEATGTLAALLAMKDKKDFAWARLGATPARYLKIIKLLLEAGGDPNEFSHRYEIPDQSRTPLRVLLELAPSSAEAVQATRLLLLHGALIRIGGYDMLAIAASMGKNDLVKAILERGHPQQASLDEAYSEALRLNQLAAAQMLVSAGANMNTRGNAQQSVLGSAMTAFPKNKERVEFLLAHGVDVNDVPPGYKTPLVLALYDDALMRALIRHGANLNARDAFGKTALRLAIETPTTVSREVGDNTPITTKYPGLDRAVRLRTVKLLLESGADPNVADNFGFTPLMFVGPSEPELLDLFLEHGAAVSLFASDMVEYHRGGIDVGPVTWAALHGNEPLALRLLKRAGRVGPSDCGVVYYAAARGEATLLDGLRRFGANFDVTEALNNYTPLMAAALRGSVPAVAVLLADNRIDVNHRTPTRTREVRDLLGRTIIVREGGVSALMRAAQSGHADVVALLLAHGADVHQTDANERTAIDYTKDLATYRILRKAAGLSAP